MQLHNALYTVRATYRQSGHGPLLTATASLLSIDLDTYILRRRLVVVGIKKKTFRSFNRRRK